MSNILKSEDFGLQLYNRFPPKYREDDALYNLSLKRYLQALSDGGFKHSIDEINGITTLIDPDKVDSNILPLLFQQYGLDVFNGIPENYLRYLLPKLGEAWSKKGSLSVVEFVTSALSGVKTSTNIRYDTNGNPLIEVKLEMDYNIGDYFPEVEQFNRLLKNFVPFYCDVSMIYSYVFNDILTLNVKEDFLDNVVDTKDEKGYILSAYNNTYFEPTLNNFFKTLNNNFELNDSVVSLEDLEVDSHRYNILFNQTEIGEIECSDDDTYTIGIPPITDDSNIKIGEYSNNSLLLAVDEDISLSSDLEETEDTIDVIGETVRLDKAGMTIFTTNSLTNRIGIVLNNSFITNSFSCYDIITKGSATEVVFN